MKLNLIKKDDPRLKELCEEVKDFEIKNFIVIWLIKLHKQV